MQQWNIPAGTATPQSVIDTFKGWLTKIPTMKTGFIVLEHDRKDVFFASKELM